MQLTPKLTDLETVDLTAAAELALLRAVRRCGGGVVFDWTALEHEMVETVSLLAQIDDALTLPPIIQDRPHA